jgi:hypothetical protein
MTRSPEKILGERIERRARAEVIALTHRAQRVPRGGHFVREGW